MPGRLEGKVIPDHIAIILDGNGRWAKRRGLPRALGHKAGCDALEQTVRDCAKIGVKYLTVYGFSTENWKRSEEEVSALMNLFRIYLKKLIGIAKEEDCRCLMIGDKSRFAPDLIAGIDQLIRETAHCRKMTFVIAINYGGRDEIARAVRRMMHSYTEHPFDIDETVTEKFVADHLDTAGIPDPDLLWPDFSMTALEDAILAYNGRERRFGGRKA